MKTTVEISVTPSELAEAFIGWGSDEQGEFINRVGSYFKRVDFPAEYQVCGMADFVTRDGRDFIYTLANFIKAKKFTSQSKHFDMLINTYETDGLYDTRLSFDAAWDDAHGGGA